MRRPVPIDRRSLIHRSRVLSLLDDWRHARLISIVAPTGYGKSTLAMEWLSSLNGPLPIWLSLDPEIVSAPLLASAIGDALQTHLPNLVDPLAELRAGGFSAMQMAHALTTEFNRKFNGDAQRCICVLDDYHLVTSPEAHQIVQHILDRGSDYFHLVLLSRTQPPLQFSRLLLHGAAIALDERHMRLDHEEFLAFVDASRLTVLSEYQRAEIERRADGWIAALRLIELSIPRTAPSGVDALLGPHSGRLLVEHLEAEVFHHLSDEMRAFLVEAAPLPFLTAELLAATTGRSAHACEALLQRALRANLFLTAYESTAGLRYRIHPLFREMLAQVGADRQNIAIIRRRAAAWLAAHDSVDQALALLLPNFPDDAADLLAGGPLRTAILDSNLVAARRWLAQIPADAVGARPQLAVDAAWLAFLAEENGLDQYADRAQASLAAFPNVAGCAELRAEAALLQVLGQLVTGQVDAALTATDAALQLPCDEFGLAAGYRRMLTVLLPGLSKSTDDRQRALRDTEAIFRRIRFSHGALEVASLRAIYAQRIGDSEGACAAFENTLAVLRSFGRENSYTAIDPHLFYGDHLYSLSRLAEARTHLERTIAISARSHIAMYSNYQATVSLQLCDLAEDKAPAHFDLQADARTWSEILSVNPLVCNLRVAWLRLVRDVRMNAPERCRQTFESLGIYPVDLRQDSISLMRLTSLAGVVFGRVPIDAATITTQLRDLCSHMESEQNLWIANRARAVLAVHLLKQDDRSGARAALQPLTTRDDCRRLLLDFPVLAQFIGAAASPSEPLSDRERDVLRWLATDRVSKEIARALSISLHTLYAHTQNIYRKLGVHTREEAVRVWKRLGNGGWGIENRE